MFIPGPVTLTAILLEYFAGLRPHYKLGPISREIEEESWRSNRWWFGAADIIIFAIAIACWRYFAR